MTTVTDYGMFTYAGTCAVDEIVREARELAGIDGPHNPVEQACRWVMNELEVLARDHFEEATDTAVREACYDRFI